MRPSTLLFVVALVSGCGAAAKPEPAAAPVTAAAAPSTAPPEGEPNAPPPPREDPPEAPPPPEPGGVSFSGGKGTSCADAVVVHAPDESTGVAAEYDWLEKHYPGYQRHQQALIQCGSRPADQLSIVTADGKALDVFFDIGEYFGKF